MTASSPFYDFVNLTDGVFSFSDIVGLIKGVFTGSDFVGRAIGATNQEIDDRTWRVCADRSFSFSHCPREALLSTSRVSARERSNILARTMDKHMPTAMIPYFVPCAVTIGWPPEARFVRNTLFVYTSFSSVH